MQLALWLFASYLLGAIPTSYVVVRLVKGEDLRRLGSGNLGATNLYRTLGWRYAIPVAVFDLLKGAVPVKVFGPLAGDGTLVPLLLGMAALLGHVFSVFVKFRGGKGVATGAGIVLGLAPGAFLVALAAWALVLALSGYVSLASIVAALLLPPAVYLLEPARRPLVWLFSVLAVLIVFFHRANIKRLLSGTEHRFGRHATAGS
ncbi:MAG TPA: glycerol-3-phosphate 1-O-acyltransferase PlsY [Gemmatimonadales bacterium]|jgi:glycerol-3-phosphate acyltransferase PlsY|nr:glycerol-3-phosphate 1-O-acyltransferase PlsY [Gemmatimonadales bacterium]